VVAASAGRPGAVFPRKGARGGLGGEARASTVLLTGWSLRLLLARSWIIISGNYPTSILLRQTEPALAESFHDSGRPALSCVACRVGVVMLLVTGQAALPRTCRPSFDRCRRTTRPFPLGLSAHSFRAQLRACKTILIIFINFVQSLTVTSLVLFRALVLNHNRL